MGRGEMGRSNLAGWGGGGETRWDRKDTTEGIRQGITAPGDNSVWLKLDMT